MSALYNIVSKSSHRKETLVFATILHTTKATQIEIKQKN